MSTARLYFVCTFFGRAILRTYYCRLAWRGQGFSGSKQIVLSLGAAALWSTNQPYLEARNQASPRADRGICWRTVWAESTDRRLRTLQRFCAICLWIRNKTFVYWNNNPNIVPRVPPPPPPACSFRTSASLSHTRCNDDTCLRGPMEAWHGGWHANTRDQPTKHAKFGVCFNGHYCFFQLLQEL